MRRLPVYILAGGRSRRFGSDKARARLNGRPLIRHVADMLEPIAASLTVVADRADKYADLGFRTIADRRPGLGPLGGLETALADLPPEADWLALCPCDALVIRRAWLARLTESLTPDGDAVAFRSERWQPMPALYARSAAATVARQVEQDRRSMQALLDRLNAVGPPLPDDWPERWQANRRSDLVAFQSDTVGR